MILYHGTNTDISVIDLTKGLKYKDFGKGFYLTPDKKTAIRMAKKKARLFDGVPTLISYELDEPVFKSNLNIKIFPERACEEWFLFVDANRNRETVKPVHDFDIIVGPITDDGVVLQLTNYREGIYSLQHAARLLQDRYLDQQYFFGTERALSFLKK